MAIALWVLCGATTLSGVFVYASREFDALFPFHSLTLDAWLEPFHRTMARATAAFIVLHIAGATVETIFGHRNWLQEIFTNSKQEKLK